MAETTYTYSIAQDMPGGAVNSTKLVAEISASAIVTKLVRVNTDGDALKIVFAAALSSGNRTLLDGDRTGPAGGLLAAHDNTPSEDPVVTQSEFREHKHGMELDGIEFSAVASKWVKADYTLPTPLHVQEAWLYWKNAQLGDYGQMWVVHPASEVNLAEAAAEGATQVNVGPYSPYFDPLAGAWCIAFWNSAEDELLEVHEITEVVGPLVKFTGSLIAARGTDVKVKTYLNGYQVVRGAAGISGGTRMIGTDHQHIMNPYSISALVPAGLKISIVVHTSAVEGTREFCTNLMFRTPEA